MTTIRPVDVGDLEALNDIYNHYVRESPATFDITPWTMERRREWLTHYAAAGPHQIVVAADDQLSGRLLGFAWSSPFLAKEAYATSVSTSVYVAAGATGQGVGALLYRALFEAIAHEDLHRAYGGITQPNAASVALHQRFGFRQAGYYTEQGRKFGRYWDVAWFEREM